MALMNECEYALTDIPAQYLQGKLDAAAAESFETHYFACDRCWSELEIGTAVRGRPIPIRGRAHRRWLPIPLSIAAAAVLVTISAWIYVGRRVPEQAPVYRGRAIPAISISTSVQGTELVIRWNAIENASSYAVTLFNSDGTERRRIRTSSTALTLQHAGRVFVRIEALDSAGDAIATSSLQPVDAAK